MKFFGFQAKLTIIFITLMIFVLSVTTFFIYSKSISIQKEELRGKILSLAKTASLLIDGKKHAQIIPRPESEGTPFYQELKAILGKIKQIDPVIADIYTMVKTDKENIWMFVVDSEDNKRMRAYCGELYDISKFSEMRLAFSAPAVDREITQDKWGLWLSSYAPIFDEQGNAVAIVGIDVSAKSIAEMRWAIARRFAMIFALGVILCAFLGFLVARSITHPLYNLLVGVREVEKGNLNKKVLLSSHDEIAELASAFNQMTVGLRQSQDTVHRHYLETIHSLADALEAKDRYTKGHSERVTHYAVDIARRMRLSEEKIALIRDICILHDIGKIALTKQVLEKCDPLSDDDWQKIKTHPLVGEAILRHIELLRPGLSIVLHHHERPDGLGYPYGLRRDEISILALIVAVADAYDAMVCERPYRKALAKEEAIKILQENKDKQFDGKVVDNFIEYLKSLDSTV